MIFGCTSSVRSRIICLILLLPAGYMWGSKRAEARPIGAGRVEAPPTRSAVESKRLRILAIRLRPGEDLRQAIEELVKKLERYARGSYSPPSAACRMPQFDLPIRKNRQPLPASLK